MRRSDGNSFREDDDGGTDINARIQDILPADGTYFVQVVQRREPPLDAPYLLSMNEAKPSLIALGQSVTNSSDRQPFWEFRGRAGQILDIALSTSDANFDPYLTLRRSDGSIVVENDNGGGGLNARIQAAVLPADGSYLIQVGRPNSVAPYRLSVAEASATPIGAGQTISAPSDGNRLWQLDAHAGQVVRIDMTSSDFDTLLEVYDPNGKLAARNDDYQGSNSRAEAVLSSNGPYLIVARPLNDGSSGAYQLSITELESTPITPPQPVEGDFAQPVVWVFAGTAGDLLRINLDPTDDPTILPSLRLVGPTGEVARADNSGQNHRTVLPLAVLPSEGLYGIIPSAQTPTGGYRLSFPRPETRPIRLGETKEVDLAEGIAWELTGAEGKRVVIRLEDAGSGIDPYLTVVDANGARRTDDDGGGGLNSQLVFEATEHPRIISPAALGGRTSGRYRLIVTESQ
ncbi:MAG: PPC domain-containing protein [Caldilineales bacterium]|nr:PPC domain-containing protein [Caldilineales bacterium]